LGCKALDLCEALASDVLQKEPGAGRIESARCRGEGLPDEYCRSGRLFEVSVRLHQATLRSEVGEP